MNKKSFSIIVIIAVFAVTYGFSQEKGKFRAGFDIRPNFDKCDGQTVGAGQRTPMQNYYIYPGIKIEYNLRKNMNVGIKLGLDMRHSEEKESGIHSSSFNFNILGTYTYFFDSWKIPVTPFIGGGLGYYYLDNRLHFVVDKKIYAVEHVGNPGLGGVRAEILPGNQIGGFLSAGFELGKFRMSAEYNMLPIFTIFSSEFYSSIFFSNHKIKISNNYWAATAGFYIGGGKWEALGNYKKYRAEKAEQRRERAEQMGAFSNKNKFAVGVNLLLGTGGSFSHFGIGGKLSYNATDHFRLAGEFDFFPKQKDDSKLIDCQWWDFSVYGHYLLLIADRMAIYPSVGFGMVGYKAELELDLGIFGSHSVSENDIKFAFSPGAGIDYSLSSNLTLNIELRYKMFAGDYLGGYRTNFAVGLAHKF